MSADSHPLIAREGWPIIAIAAGVVVVLAFVSWLLAFLAALGLAFVIQFFRDPHREIPDEEDAVLAPADGRVIEVAPGIDPQNGRAALKISVFMNVFNVHSNRIPASGEIVAEEYHSGAFFNAALAKASDANERKALTIRTERGELTCVQIAGLVARRILCYVGTGDQVEAGQRYGFIRFGSRVDVYLPPDSVPRVAPGDLVSAGSDVIARFPEKDG